MRFKDIPSSLLHYCEDCDYRGLGKDSAPCHEPTGAKTNPERNIMGTCRYWAPGDDTHKNWPTTTPQTELEAEE